MTIDRNVFTKKCRESKKKGFDLFLLHVIISRGWAGKKYLQVNTISNSVKISYLLKPNFF